MREVVSRGWLVHFPPRHLREALGLRTLPGAEIRIDEEGILVRGPEDHRPEPARLHRLAPGGLYRFEGDRVRREGRRVPEAKLPPDGWRPIHDAASPEFPAGAAPAPHRPAPVRLRLVRGGEVREPSLLITDAAAFGAWGTIAPRIRLDRLRWVWDGAESALVFGNPLPPLPGARFVLAESIATPAGLCVDPVLPPSLLRSVLGLRTGDLAVFYPDGDVEVMDNGLLAPVTRSGIRETLGEVES